MALTTVEDVRRAARHLDGVAVRTPLVAVPAWPGLWLKPENLQPVGAFKVRGAVHAVASLPDNARAAGVVTHSSGNHGQALAFAARRLGVACAVVMPHTAPRVKQDAVRALGAEVVAVEPDERERRCAELAGERGLALIPPYDHPDVIAGQGTVGLEIVADLPEVACVLVPVGGGGLASGVATAIKALRPQALVLGVEPELAADAQQSLAEGRRVVWPTERTYRTMADGLRTNLSDLTFAHLRSRLDGIVTVTEDQIRSTVAALAHTARLVAEPSGAVAPAGWLHPPADLADRLRRGPTVAVISGGNVDAAQFVALLSSHR